jgi:plastocyanin
MNMNSTKKSAALACLAAGLCTTAAQAQVTHDVIVGPAGDIVFEPAEITINVGDTVRWTWGSTGHNVGSGVPGAPTPAFLSGPPQPIGTVYELVFDEALLSANPIANNRYDYHCHPHGSFGMVGAVTVLDSCYADCDQSTGAGTLDIFDFLCFQNSFVSGEPYACDCDTSTGPGVCDIFDFLCFQNAFVGGCP